MNAQRQFNITGASIKKTTEKLSSGYRINRAADDAAGLTISEKMRSLIRGMNQGSDNIQDGISVMQIADGALAEVHDMLHRMTELSVKAANGTETAADRAAIQSEITALSAEITRIGKTTTFNTLHILDNGEPYADAESITELVKCESAKTGYMNEAYNYPKGTNNYYPAAILDFSGLNRAKIEKLIDKSFSFVCGFGCGETFKFTFTTGTDVSLDKETYGGVHNYSVGVDGINDGVTLAQKIYDAVDDKPIKNRSGEYYNPEKINGGLHVSHDAGLVYDPSEPAKLTVFQNSRSSTETGAKQKYNGPGNEGSIDCSQITKANDGEEFVNKFNIQCSNITDDYETIETYRMNAEVLGVHDVDVTTQENARKALAKIDNALAKVSKHRSAYGAFQNRLEHSYDNNNNKAENLTDAESRIRDTDMSKEMVEYTKSNILSQAGSAMLSQSMQNPQMVLQLLS